MINNDHKILEKNGIFLFYKKNKTPIKSDNNQSVFEMN